MAPLTDDDRVLIRLLRTDKGWNSYQMIKEFPNRGWTKRTLNRIICQIDHTGTSTRKQYERQSMARTPANIARVADLICSQEDPGTSKSPREIERETGISRTTVRRIAKDNLNLKFNGNYSFLNSDRCIIIAVQTVPLVNHQLLSHN